MSGKALVFQDSLKTLWFRWNNWFNFSVRPFSLRNKKTLRKERKFLLNRKCNTEHLRNYYGISKYINENAHVWAIFGKLDMQDARLGDFSLECATYTSTTKISNLELVQKSSINIALPCSERVKKVATATTTPHPRFTNCQWRSALFEWNIYICKSVPLLHRNHGSRCSANCRHGVHGPRINAPLGRRASRVCDAQQV